MVPSMGRPRSSFGATSILYAWSNAFRTRNELKAPLQATRVV